MSMAKILILTGDAAESLEVMYPYQRLQEEGYDHGVGLCATSGTLTLYSLHRRG